MLKEELSLSVFALEVDRRPVIAFSSKTHAAAEAFINNERIRKRLCTLRSRGALLYDNNGIMHLRLARPPERDILRDERFGRLQHLGVSVVLLVELDQDGGGQDQALEELMSLGSRDRKDLSL